MKYYKKVIAGALLVVMFTSTTAFAGFTDVPSNAWYAEDVETVQSLGIMQGTGNNSFNPNGTLSYGEEIAIAAKIHSMKHNQQIPVSNGAWYQGAVDYAYENGLLPEHFKHLTEVAATPHGQTYYDLSAGRDVVAYCFAHVLSENEYTPINTVEMILDVPESQYYYTEVMKLYRAGILSGSGENKEFKPSGKITRAETAAIVNRLVNTDKRQHFTIAELKEPEGLTALPDGSNVSDGGMIFPKEGDIINGVKVTRDPATGILGLGNGQHGGIYLGIKSPSNGYTIQVGSEATSSYDNMGGTYEQKGSYIFWHDEWLIIQGAGQRKVEQIANPTEGMVADIFGNVTTGTFNTKDVFFVYTGSYWQWIGNSAANTK